MTKMNAVIGTALLLGVAALLFVASDTHLPSWKKLVSNVFSESITPDDVKLRYRDSHVRVVVAAGHDEDHWGARFGDLKEEVLTRGISKHLTRFLEEDPYFSVTAVRDGETGAYTPEFAQYFDTRRSEILEFMQTQREGMRARLFNGEVVRNVTIAHNPAPREVAIRLYGINHWANQRDIDLLVHLHVNDYPTRASGLPGKHSGFSVYIPESQYPNARASRAMAETLYAQLARFVGPSTLPGERAGIIESQELIALGSNASQESASLFIEYGYIYEPQFLNPVLREQMLQELAFQTYVGIRRYFSEEDHILDSGYATTLLPHTFSRDLERGEVGSVEVLALQAALHEGGWYPPGERSLTACPINGNFGPCVEQAVKDFQVTHEEELRELQGPQFPSGRVDSDTRRVLNEWFGGAKKKEERGFLEKTVHFFGNLF